MVVTNNLSTQTLWDTVQGHPLHTFTGSLNNRMEFTANNRYLLILDGERQNPDDYPAYVMWDIKLNKQRPDFYFGKVSGELGVSPNGKYLVVGSDDKELRLWNLLTSEELQLEC